MSAPILETYLPRITGPASSPGSRKLCGSFSDVQVIAEGASEFDVPPSSVDVLVLPLKAGKLTGRRDGRLRDVDWQPGQCVFIPAGLSTWWAKHKASSVVHVHMRPDSMLNLAEYAETAHAKRLLIAEPEPFISEIGDVLVRMANASFLDRLHHDSLTIVLAYRLARLFDATPRLVKGGLAPWQLRRIQAKLTEDLSRNIGLDELASLVDLSPTYLCTAFRHSTGMPPHQWQKHQRVERAKVLLEAGRASVTEIALDVGYGNPGHFATAFKAATGKSPLAWRRERAT